ncbi:MAG TPA: hypothetical protein DHV14_01465 [Micrococcales bacterium]|uniref:helix-turn-helix domain-containing protein n=1 Tax=Miniimonas arenae TaxID=676201 RepID=UPI000EBCAD54|nr:helix-turn-helix transcriptional regulator [Miniimonas arenae]HCX83811.1 hypothetical protein [Micrococcales bacterium]
MPPNVARDPSDENVWAVYSRALGLRLRAAREAHGLSQRELADAAGVNSNTVKGIEHGTSSTKGLPGSTTIRTLVRISAALGLPPVELLPPLAEVPPSDPGATIDLAWPADDQFVAQVHRHALPTHTERARRGDGSSLRPRAE